MTQFGAQESVVSEETARKIIRVQSSGRTEAMREGREGGNSSDFLGGDEEDEKEACPGGVGLEMNHRSEMDRR